MRIGIWNFYEELNRNNYMLLHPDAPIGDGLLKPINDLYRLAQAQGVGMDTLDMVSDFSAIDAFLFMDFPDLKHGLVKQAFASGAPKYLILWESELIRPANWKRENHSLFRKIFTWNDAFVDNTKYYKINYAQVLPPAVECDRSKRVKFCTMIVSNKKSRHPLELYSKRVEAIRWFERNHPDEFDLYGVGWDAYCFGGIKPVRALNRFHGLQRLFAPTFPSYRGTVQNKRLALAQYRFAICYENARDIPGYITEKIFDCFFAGCIPVYWGANNIADHIPEQCFIDKRKLRTYEDLYAHLKSISPDDHERMVMNIGSFLRSPEAYPFSSDYFCKTLLQEMMTGTVPDMVLE